MIQIKKWIVVLQIITVACIFSQEHFNVDWSNNKVYSSTIVKMPLSNDFVHRRLKGLEEAKEKARVNYYRALRNIRLSDNGENLYEYFDTLGDRKSLLFTLLDNAKLYRLEYPDINTIKVTYFIDIYGTSDSILNIIMGGTSHYTEELTPYMGFNFENNFTGIVIDARDELQSFENKSVIVKPSIFLTIKDTEGNIVFNRYHVLSEVIQDRGMVRYSYDIKEKIPERVGRNPLQVVAYGTGDEFGSVLVVSMKDARLMLSSTATRNAIKNGKVNVIINN